MSTDPKRPYEVRIMGAVTGLPSLTAATKRMGEIERAAREFERTTGVQLDVRVSREDAPWTRREVAA